MPVISAPPRYSPSRGDDIEGGRRAEVDAHCGAAEALADGDRVDEPVGADLARVVVADRHARLRPRPDRVHLLGEIAAGHRRPLGLELGHGGGDDRGVQLLEAVSAQLEQVAQRGAELVGGRLADGRKAPVLEQLLARERRRSGSACCRRPRPAASAQHYARPGRCARLDPKSLGQHVDRLYRAAWALCGSREDAEDLVQETFARVLQRTRVLTGDDELYYLMRVLRNTFLTSRRTAGRRPQTVATLEDVAAADPRPMGQPQQALEMQEVYATIAELPEDFRMALVAVDVLGLSYREAARALHVREATITTRLFRARKQVAGRLLPDPRSRSGRADPPGARAAGARAAARSDPPSGKRRAPAES